MSTMNSEEVTVVPENMEGLDSTLPKVLVALQKEIDIDLNNIDHVREALVLALESGETLHDQVMEREALLTEANKLINTAQEALPLMKNEIERLESEKKEIIAQRDKYGKANDLLFAFVETYPYINEKRDAKLKEAKNAYRALMA